jgi:hypothetical protein
VNSVGQVDNGFPSDADVVEGTLMFAKQTNGGAFSAPQQAVTAVSGYPKFALGAPTALLFANFDGSACASGQSCVTIYLSQTQ